MDQITFLKNQSLYFQNSQIFCNSVIIEIENKYVNLHIKILFCSLLNVIAKYLNFIDLQGKLSITLQFLLITSILVSAGTHKPNSAGVWVLVTKCAVAHWLEQPATSVKKSCKGQRIIALGLGSYEMKLAYSLKQLPSFPKVWMVGKNGVTHHFLSTVKTTYLKFV